MGTGDNRTARWISLDPTPGTSRDESVAQVGGMVGKVRPLTDLLRYIWVFYILGYDSSRQNRLLYDPLTYTIRKNGATAISRSGNGPSKPHSTCFNFRALARSSAFADSSSHSLCSCWPRSSSGWSSG